MKPSFSCAVVLCLYPTFTVPVSAQDFRDKIRPVVEFEHIPLTNGSVQHSIAIETKPGLLYTFQSSDDLISWNDDAVYYSLGQKLTHALRESTPPPPPDPEAPPAAPYPSAFATLLVQPSSGTSGGTVVSWRSLDDGSAVTYHITGDMDAAWQLVPLIVCDYDNHQFFFSHPPGSIAPPAENPALGEKDSIMIAVLEDRLDEINQSLINSAYQTQHTPAPAPTAMQRRFLRVRATAVDTDGDNVTDFDEFQLAGDDNPLGNAFNPDADGNGEPDDQQVDTDKDGQVNANDATPADSTAAYAVVPNARYALFEAPSGGIQISDRGTVLYHDGTWRAGVKTPIPGGGRALAINNNDVIIGIKPRPGPTGDKDYVCYWPTPTTPAQAVIGTNSYPWTGENVSTPGTVLTDGGLFPAGIFDGVNDGAPGIWQLPINNLSVTATPCPIGVTNLEPNGLMWGTDNTQGIVYAPDKLPPLSFVPQNVIRHILPNGRTSVFALAPHGIIAQSRVSIEGVWKESATYMKAVDIASNGSAIGRNHDGKLAPVLQNGKWISIERAAPDIPSIWKDGTVQLHDITPGGWILGDRGNDEQSGVMLPLQVRGSYETTENEIITTHEEAAGVDDFSISSPTPDVHPGNLQPVKEKIWIMAPLGGPQKTITINAPLNADTPLKLSAPGIKFDNAGEKILTASQSTFPIRAEGEIAPGTEIASGMEIPLKLQFGDVTSSSQPIAFKVMKARTVKVVVYNISRKTETGSTVALELKPTQAAITRHLNELYGPQINVTFEMTYHDTEIPVKWDKNGDHKFNHRRPEPTASFEDHSDDELEIIKEAHRLHPLSDPAPNIEIYIIASDLGALGNSANSHGITKRANRVCWLLGSEFGEYQTNQNLIDTIGHEIGHIFFGYGHPNSILDNKGRAPLKDTDYRKRLMREGPHINLNARLTVKAEWDELINWTQGEITANRMAP